MPGKMEDLTPAQVVRKLTGHEIMLIDVHEPAEFAVERIHGALLYPLSTFDPTALPADLPIVFQCGSGMRSAKAMVAAGKAGIEVAGHLAGGLKAWKEAGLPTVATDPATGKLWG